MSGLYVHVPFCAALCPYCDFAVVVGREELHARYCDALIAEAEATASDVPGPFTTMFIGGGTPTFVDPGLLVPALRKLRALLGVADEAETTVEANPESVTEPALRALRDAGVNRVSIGAQSFRPHVLTALGRTHAPDDTERAIAAARAAGYGNISLDLIYGAPGETTADWRATLERALALEPEHISCYALTIEERTPFGRAVARGAMSEPDQDALAERYELAAEMLVAAGFEHYELSNWALPGYESRHNLVYWTQGDYLGLGLGSHSHHAGRRWWNTRALGHYLGEPAGARAGEEVLDAAHQAEEWLQLRLRLVEGVDLEEAARRLGRDLAAPVSLLAREGLGALGDGRLRLTTRGMLLENEVAVRLLDS